MKGKSSQSTSFASILQAESIKKANAVLQITAPIDSSLKINVQLC